MECQIYGIQMVRGEAEELSIDAQCLLASLRVFWGCIIRG